MAEQNEIEQEIHLSEDTTSFQKAEDQEHEDFIPQLETPRGIWEELGLEIHELVEYLASKLQKSIHLEKLLQEKPNDSEDKADIANWLDKLINLVKAVSEDTEEDSKYYTSRDFDASKIDVTKLDRFKVKNLAGGSASTVKDDKKK